MFGPNTTPPVISQKVYISPPKHAGDAPTTTLGEAFEPLADYAKTNLSEDMCETPIDKNPILMKAVNTSE